VIFAKKNRYRASIFYMGSPILGRVWKDDLCNQTYFDSFDQFSFKGC